MAQVDFTNAHIEPMSSGTVNITSVENVGMVSYNNRFFDSNIAYITNAVTTTRMVNEQKKLVYKYQGTFTANGTEFFIRPSSPDPTGWRVYNISFNNGDTFDFSIQADLICQ